MRFRRSLDAASLLALLLSACGDSESKPSAPSGTGPSAATHVPRPAGHIVVDHILIKVRSRQSPQATRDETDARMAAYELLDQLKAGGNWATLKRANSEDGSPGAPGGPYALADRGLTPAADERSRDGMVAAFGDVGFRLAVGEMAIANYDPATSPYGFHIIKRIE
jgi:parvulin-like peptidyl-prolyl isomerase